MIAHHSVPVHADSMDTNEFSFMKALLTALHIIRSARGKFELPNQDSAGGKSFTALTLMQVNRKTIEISQRYSLEMALQFPKPYQYVKK